MFQFGDFSLDVAERRLSKGGKVIPLMPKAFDLLVVLATSDGKLISKNELMERVWPDVAVEESNLTNNITLLRKTLGKDAIETVPRYGYRFAAPVRQGGPPVPILPMSSGSVTIERHAVTRIVTEEIDVPDEPVVELPAREIRALPPAPVSGWRKSAFVLGGFLLLVAAGTGGWWLARRNPAVDVAPFSGMRQVPFTTEPGQEMRPSFSPDGKKLAFIWDGPGGDNFDIYIKDVGGIGMRRLTTDPAFDSSPVWSPDGKTIAFLRKLESEYAVVLISADGGPERTLATCTDGLSWTPDGKSLSVSDRTRPDVPPRVHLLSVETGQKRLLATDLEAPGEDTRSAVSPDGSTVAILRLKGETGAILTVPISGGPPKTILDDNKRYDSLVWMPDGRGILFVSSRGGEFAPWIVSPEGGTPVPVPSLDGPVRDMAAAPDGTKFAFRRTSSDLNAWKLKFGGEKGNLPVRLTDSTRMDDSPQASPDGKRIAFMSARNGNFQIWVCDENGGNLTQLTTYPKGLSGSPRWSPDGSTILFDRHLNGIADVMVVPASGGEPKTLTEGKFRNVLPSWSGDGKWIYFCSNRTGTNQIWRIPAGGGEPVQMTKQGGWEAFESADGRSLFFTRGRDIPGVWRLDLATGAETLVTELSKAGRNRSWYPGKTGLYFVSFAEPRSWVLNRFDFATRKIMTLATIASSAKSAPGNLMVSADETTAYFVQDELTGSDLVLVTASGQ